MSNFERVIGGFRAESDSTVDLGNSFERLIKNFLIVEPTYNFSDVWLWSEFPYRDSKDVGIDIVARTKLDEYWAIQCKFYQPHIRIDKPVVDSFLGASSRAFVVDGQTKMFSQRLWISTTDLWNENAAREIEHQTPPVRRLGLYELEQAAVDWSALERGELGQGARLKKSLRDHQTAAVEAAVEYYRDHDRGKMIMACGSGKTFTSLKIAEHLLMEQKDGEVDAFVGAAFSASECGAASDVPSAPDVDATPPTPLPTLSAAPTYAATRLFAQSPSVLALTSDSSSLTVDPLPAAPPTPLPTLSAAPTCAATRLLFQSPTVLDLTSESSPSTVEPLPSAPPTPSPAPGAAPTCAAARPFTQSPDLDRVPDSSSSNVDPPPSAPLTPSPTLSAAPTYAATRPFTQSPPDLDRVPDSSSSNADPPPAAPPTPSPTLSAAPTCAAARPLSQSPPDLDRVPDSSSSTVETLPSAPLTPSPTLSAAPTCAATRPFIQSPTDLDRVPDSSSSNADPPPATPPTPSPTLGAAPTCAATRPFIQSPPDLDLTSDSSSSTVETLLSAPPAAPPTSRVPRGIVLYLTPSISLLNQTLVEWTAQSDYPVNVVCVCSDKTASKTDEDISTAEMILPSTTDPDEIAGRLRPDAFNVIFATYQSLEAVAAAQALFEQPFDLIICDEAHRTTGFVEVGADAPLFKKVHDNNFVRAKKRLYMTATPRLYTTAVKKSAAEKDLILWSMDDESVFGEDFYVLKFSDALEHKLLTDYRVLVFTVREEDVPDTLKEQFNVSDIAKIYGAVNALRKKLSRESQYILRDDPNLMRSAVAYCSSIKLSKTVAAIFNSVDSSVRAEHVDGSMRSDQRRHKLSLLRHADDNSCRILTNARCLSEGIDVPALDAVLFLSPRKSQVDIIQAVGRVMRAAEGKRYGYVILPVVIPLGADPVEELNHNKDFDVVWKVLNALRAHDDRFYIEVNKLALNNSDHIVNGGKLIVDAPRAFQLSLNFGEYKQAILARIVEKVGDRQYWATWGRDVAVIAERHKARIKKLIAVEGKHRDAFNEFLDGLRRDINPDVSSDDAVDMLSQHLITRPVFEALFENYNFMSRNAVSRSMDKILSLLVDAAADKENAALNDIYKSVRERCADINSAADRQKIIIELYDKFFKVALHKTVEKLGIVYTPVEVVDFILKSVDAVLRAEFERTLSGAGVHILDPFTGTGTFITRLLELGLIDDANLRRKYRDELHANEIVLLAYYIAAVNIENAFHARAGADKYLPFDNICLTDTFRLAELDDVTNLFSDVLAVNNHQIERQRSTDIQVIVGNPPYSVGQRSANDNAQNQKYPALERRITETYVKHTDATNKNSLYDSYIKAFRWASDRLDERGGVIGFVTNGSWLDTAAMDGLRACFEEEFSAVYVFNLRGNQRTQGETSRREGGKIFDSGSRAPIAITILVKAPRAEGLTAKIYYVDIGDYLDRKAKLDRIVALDNVLSDRFMSEARVLVPNARHDWINQRGDRFDEFIPIAPEKKFDGSARSFFSTYSRGVATARDAWIYNYSRDDLERNMRRTISFYNKNLGSDPIYDSTQINWVRSTIQSLKRGEKIIFDDDRIVEGFYRPFCRQHLYYDRQLIDMTYQMSKIFPTGREDNLMICVPGLGSGNKNFSVMITDRITDVMLLYAGQCFPMWWYDGVGVRHEGVTDHILSEARRRYGSGVSKEDIFYYVYGFLHLRGYREKFANELRKSLPKLILVSRAEEFVALSDAGRRLAELHLNYESQPAPEGVLVEGVEKGDYRVGKMRLSKDRRELKYNGSIVVKNIPLRSYEYVVNGRSPLEWVIDRYQVRVDKASGLKNDPNVWCEERGDMGYILRLLLSVLTVSVRTVEIVDGLPEIDIDD